MGYGFSFVWIFLLETTGESFKILMSDDSELRYFLHSNRLIRTVRGRNYK